MSIRDLRNKFQKWLLRSKEGNFDLDGAFEILDELDSLEYNGAQPAPTPVLPESRPEPSTGSTEKTAQKAKRKSTRRKRQARKDHPPTKVSIRPIKDWLLVKEAARELAISERDIQYMLDNDHITPFHWHPTLPCVHVGQVGRYMSGEPFDIAPHLENAQEWTTMTDMGRRLGITNPPGPLWFAVRDNHLACHTAGKSCRLVKITECEDFWRTRES